MKNNKLSITTNGIIKSNPIFKMVLGTCPTLAVTTTLYNSVGMGLATMFVLVMSNFLISLLRGVIPDKIRIPCYIIIIATFVTVIMLLVEKFLPLLNDSLGVFLPLIVVNCLIFARAESFASTNTVVDSVLDAVGMGLGFTLALSLIGSIREFLSMGSVGGIIILGSTIPKLAIFALPAGGFLAFGLIMAMFNYISKRVKNA